jgi:photosystem II stability/assembly factor-like uncharacterized protein
MVTSSAGWSGTSRTTDGGVTWKDVSPPSLPNEIKGSRVACVLDTDHAWVTEVAGSSETQPGQLLVFITHDGGQTWQESAPIPITGATPEVQLQFIDDRHGWLVTDSGSNSAQPTVSLYTTADAGLYWNRVASSSGSDSSVLGADIACIPTGMTFVSLSRGWLTWDCTTRFFDHTTMVAITTNDGGSSWAPQALDVRSLLPSFPFAGSNTGPNNSAVAWSCGAKPPIFGGSQGVLPVTCAAYDTQQNECASLAGPIPCDGPTGSGWSGAFRTNDSGATWNASPLPAYVGLSQIDFVDANTGFAFVHGATANDLYRTTNAGRDWANARNGLFPGLDVISYQFIDPTTGFAYTDSSPSELLETSDGGRTWSLSAHLAVLPVLNAWFYSAEDVAVQPEPRAGPWSPSVGDVLISHDAGRTWVRTPVNYPLVNLRWLDSKHIVAAMDNVGPPNLLESTADGGGHWQGTGGYHWQTANGILQWPSFNTFFLDANEGWALCSTFGPCRGSQNEVVSETGIYHTLDSGAHWQQIGNWVAPAGVVPNELLFTDAEHGFLAATSGDAVGRLFVTIDGGKTWRLMELPAPPGGWQRSAVNVLAPAMFGTHGVLLVDAPGGGFTYTATDGGLIWGSPHAVPTQALQIVPSLAPLDSTNWWIVDARGELFGTSDGSQRWQRIQTKLPSGYTLVTVSPVGGSVLWGTATTDGGKFLFPVRSVDGGTSWSVLELPAT